MAKIIEKIKDLMFGEYEDEDDDDFNEEFDEQPELSETPYTHKDNVTSVREYRERENEPTPLRRSASSQTSYSRNNQTASGSAKSTRNNPQIYPINTNVQMQVVIIKPESYEDAQEICDHIKSNKPVVVNLEKVEFPLAQRIMDFLSGACYSLEGSIQRVANNIFIIAPENVELTGDFKEELKTKGFNLPWASSGR